MSKSRKKRKLRKGPLILLIVLLILILAACSSVLWYVSALKPAGTASTEETIEITEGESFEDLADQLEKDGLIQSALAAKIYAKLNNASAHYAGNYRLNEGMSTPAILKYLGNPDNQELTYAVVTIPEGYWASQVADVLASHFPQYSAEDFMTLWNDTDYINALAKDYSFLNTEILDNDQLKVKLEGYLFPETYYIDYDSTPDQITRTFLDQFQKIYDKYKSEIDASPYSLEEILTLASIVQFESGDAAEMPTIAGVFYNRLDQNMPLQSSVTVCYAIGDKSDAQACETQTDVDSPYNTYLHEGLPIGPILNPGEEAIKAVLEPEKTDYLYFVSDIHGDGSIHYATTYEEHEANVEKYNLKIEN